MLLTEGYNEPSIDCIVNLRLTRSETLLRQILGRGTRKEEGKDNLLILDFFWKDKKGRHALSVADIIASELGVDERDVEELSKRCKKEKGSPVDVIAYVKTHHADVVKEREQALLRALKRAEAERLKKEKIEEMRKRFSSENPDLMQTLSDDPIHVLPRLIRRNEARQISKHVYLIKDNHGSTFFYTKIPLFKALGIDCYKIRSFEELDPPSEKQSQCLKNFGIEGEVRTQTGEYDCFINKGYSNFIISTLMERRSNGLCSYKQAKILCKKGVLDCTSISFETASKAIDLLSRNNWVAGKAFWSLIDDALSGQERLPFIDL